jgi:hypothetical protein
MTKTLPHVRLSRLPRMADFALWSVACEAFAGGAFGAMEGRLRC